MSAVENGNYVQENVCSANNATTPLTTITTTQGTRLIQNNNEQTNAPSLTTTTDDIEIDISEEMEEIRESVYELLSKYPNGVSATHLANLYQERYVQNDSQKLPHNWLDQIKLADEFEIKQVGPIVMIYQRQKHVPSVDNISKTPKLNNNAYQISVLDKDNSDKDMEKIISNISMDDLKKKPVPAPTTFKQKQEYKSSSNSLSNDLDEQAKLGYATYIASNGDIYFKVIENESNVLKLFNEMNIFYLKNAVEYGQLEQSLIKKDEYYAYFDRLAKQTFRILLLEEIKEGCPSVEGRLIDHGMRKPIPIGTIKKLAHQFKVNLISPYSICVDFNKKHGNNVPKGFYNQLIVRGNPMNTPVLIKINLETKDLFTQENVLLKPSSFGDDKGLTLPLSTPSQIAHSSDVGTESNRSTDSGRSTPSISNFRSIIDSCQIKPFELAKMPTEKFMAKLLVFKDPYNITFRLQTMEPIYNYMQDNLIRHSQSQTSPPPANEIKAGAILAASMGPGNWQRVILIKSIPPAQTSNQVPQNLWLVFALDLGIQTTCQERNLRALSDSTKAVDKMLCFRAKLHNIRPIQEAKVSTKAGGTITKKVWNRDDLKQLKTMLFTINSPSAEDPKSNNNSGYSVFNLTPKVDWTTYKKEDAPNLPFVSASITFNGNDLSQYLIDEKLAE
uniref:HTH OST-type domain-containing protein n=1 Tax=Rhabditophanes sp. KR3021 TaxID=114890 RepID=A0AC35U0K7_9BILA